jgi:hypothetical protein
MTDVDEVKQHKVGVSVPTKRCTPVRIRHNSKNANKEICEDYRDSISNESYKWMYIRRDAVSRGRSRWVADCNPSIDWKDFDVQ